MRAIASSANARISWRHDSRMLGKRQVLEQARIQFQTSGELAADVDDVFGVTRNPRLEEAIVRQLSQAERKCAATGKAPSLFRDIATARSVAGAAGAVSSATLNAPCEAPTPASSSPCCAAPPLRPARSMKTSIAPATRLKTASVSRSNGLPIAPPRRQRRPTSCRWFAAIACVRVNTMHRNRAARHAVCRGPSLHHPSQATQARGPRAHQRARVYFRPHSKLSEPG
jgi:hypothetical protein